ncbi:hypothetical protein CEXT_693231 [Caerostris extrusa]|uniref:Uncharacterized protein n=1 Tax=Caerostris extrusa TaxID=172846 RepID=A0AAV4T0X7_CAEEX|nr:hypothetical protein CEXT_693231 [Caerostris extrusa]
MQITHQKANRKVPCKHPSSCKYFEWHSMDLGQINCGTIQPNRDLCSSEIGAVTPGIVEILQKREKTEPKLEPFFPPLLFRIPRCPLNSTGNRLVHPFPMDFIRDRNARHLTTKCHPPDRSQNVLRATRPFI